MQFLSVKIDINFSLKSVCFTFPKAKTIVSHTGPIDAELKLMALSIASYSRYIVF